MVALRRNMVYLKREREIAIAKSRAFCKTSTLHGIHYFSEKQHWTVYAIWTTILLASIMLCGFLCRMIWNKFITDPTFTVVESTHYSTADVPFPAVTVCDPSLVYGPNTHNITDILQRRGFNDTQIDDFYASFANVQKLDYSPPEYVSKMHKVLGELGFTLQMLLNMLGKPCEVLLKTCLWRDNEHNCSDMFQQVYTLAGYCCKFQMKYFMSRADPSTSFESGIDYSEALGLVVNGVRVSFNGTTQDGHLFLYVYDDASPMSLMTSPTMITPFGYFDISVLVWVIESSDDVRSLSLASRKCIIDSELIANVGLYTDQKNCISVLILKTAAIHCRCLPFNYEGQTLDVEDYPVCTWDRVMCIHRKMAEVQINIKDLPSVNECRQRCDYAQYNTEIDYVKNNRQSPLAKDGSSGVSIHFSSNTCLKYRREVLYAWDQVLANIGGIFGLCLGGSIISILELLWFTADLIYGLIANARMRKINEIKDKDKSRSIFTLSEKNFTKNYDNVIQPPKKIAKYKFVH